MAPRVLGGLVPPNLNSAYVPSHPFKFETSAYEREDEHRSHSKGQISDSNGHSQRVPDTVRIARSPRNVSPRIDPITEETVYMLGHFRAEHEPKYCSTVFADSQCSQKN